MAYFVTGATGFIGRHLMERLLANRQGKVYVLVREGSTGRLDELIDRWAVATGRPPRPNAWCRSSATCAGRCWGSTRSRSRELRGQDRALLPPRRRLRHDRARRARTSRRTSAAPRTRSSSRARWRPAACTTSPRSPSPAPTRGRSARRCSTRARSCPRPTTARSSRPSGSCASSRSCRGASTGRRSSSATRSTGEMDKVDGPYYFFKAIQRARQLLPEWLPLVGLDLGHDQRRAGRLGRRARWSTSRTSPTSTAAPSI